MIYINIFLISALIGWIVLQVTQYKQKQAEANERFENKIKGIYDKQVKDWEFYIKVMNDKKSDEEKFGK